MHSCLYRGTVAHRRQTPVEHAFRYRLFWLFIDLDEWAEVRRKVVGLTDRWFSLASFHRCDHLGDPSKSLREAVRDFVRQESGSDMATGPIRLLTQPRSFGLYFSPLNLYYCHDDQESLTAVVAEVNNTPWGERHCYLLWHGNQAAGGKPGEYRHPKAFHVSPFMPMQQQYAWRIGEPADTLSVELSAVRGDLHYFDANMRLAREPLTSWTLAANLARSPINAGRVLAAIYFEAFRLWMKRCPYYPHPKTKATDAPAL